MRYSEKMEMLQSARDIKYGDRIKCQNVICTVGEIFYYDKYVEEKDGKYEVFYDIEVRDLNGHDRHWKSYFDGGKLLPA